jgi:hypothetical protein
MSTTLKAFVIMPFEPEFKSIYDDLIKPALEDAGYEVARADSFTDQQNILRDIIQGIARADLIVADLTTLNANVFYELGLCHGLRIPTVLLAQSIEEVPFDLRSYKIQIYDTRFDKIHKLMNALKEIAEKHIKREITFGSPVIDFFPSEGSLLAKNSIEVVVNEDEPAEEPSEEVEEKGILDYSAEVEEALAEMSRVLQEITKENEAIGNKAAGHAARMQALNVSSSAGTAGQKKKIGLQIASDMNASAKKIEEELPKFEEAINVLDESFAGMMNYATTHREQQEKEQLMNMREALESFLGASSTGTNSMRGLRNVVAGLKGMSKDVNRASRRLTHAYDGIIQNLEKVEAFAARAVALLHQWLDEDDPTIN